MAVEAMRTAPRDGVLSRISLRERFLRTIADRVRTLQGSNLFLGERRKLDDLVTSVVTIILEVYDEIKRARRATSAGKLDPFDVCKANERGRLRQDKRRTQRRAGYRTPLRHGARPYDAHRPAVVAATSRADEQSGCQQTERKGKARGEKGRRGTTLEHVHDFYRRAPMPHRFEEEQPAGHREERARSSFDVRFDAGSFARALKQGGIWRGKRLRSDAKRPAQRTKKPINKAHTLLRSRNTTGGATRPERVHGRTPESPM